MRKETLICAFLFATLTFGFGLAVARADLGWFQYSTPCVSTAVAMTEHHIAVTCAGDRHVYVKER